MYCTILSLLAAPPTFLQLSCLGKSTASFDALHRPAISLACCLQAAVRRRLQPVLVEVFARWQAAVQIVRSLCADIRDSKAHFDKRRLEGAFASWKAQQEYSAAQRRSMVKAAEAPHTRLAVQNEVRLWLDGRDSTQGHKRHGCNSISALRCQQATCNSFLCQACMCKWELSRQGVGRGLALTVCPYATLTSACHRHGALVCYTSERTHQQACDWLCCSRFYCLCKPCIPAMLGRMRLLASVPGGWLALSGEDGMWAGLGCGWEVGRLGVGVMMGGARSWGEGGAGLGEGGRWAGLG